MKPRRKLIIWIITSAIALTTVAYLVYNNKRKSSTVYTEYTITRGDLEISVQASGTVQPENRLVVKPQIAGRVDEILVDEGKSVKAGQILAWMSSNDRAALMDMAKSAGPAEQQRWNEIYKPSPIIAPLGGVVISKQVERGQTVSTGDTVFIISDRLIVLAQVDETDLSKIKLGQSAEIRVDAYNDQPITGRVIRIAYESRQVNNVTIYEIRILPTETPLFMRSGMTASVKFMQQRINQALLFPASMVPSAIGKEQNPLTSKPYNSLQINLLVKSSNPKIPATERSVTLGSNNGKFYEIVDGLQEGDIILRADQTISESQNSTNPFSPFGSRKSNRK